MSTPQMNDFDAVYAARWLNGGKPILKGLVKTPTLYMTFGRPTESIDTNDLTKVEFANMNPVGPNDKLINFSTRGAITGGGAEIARGAPMIAMSTATQEELLKAYQVSTSFWNVDTLIGDDRLMENDKSSGLQIDIPYEQHLMNAVIENYCKQSARKQFAVGANKLPVDGSLGSFRAMISDGLNSTQRGSGGDESNYRFIYGTDRTSDTTHTAQYDYEGGGAYTEDIGAKLARTCEEFGTSRMLVPMNNARFSKFEARMRSAYGSTLLRTPPDDLLYALGGRNVITHNSIVYYYEPALNFMGATTWLLMLDPEVMAFGSSFQSTKLRLVDAAERSAAHKLKGLIKHQNFITDLRRCALIENLESK